MVAARSSRNELGITVPQRKVILHYHIFKNAGTSIDRMLRESYGGRWLYYDKPEGGAKISPAEMEAFILDHPDALAFSSHQVVPPLPSRHLEVFPIVLLRHPIDRAYSAYLFEWQKQQGGTEPVGSFADYIAEKFRYPRRNAIEDFQAFHLANLGYCDWMPATDLDDEDILRHARRFLVKMGCFGIVDRYAESLRWFKKKLGPHFPDLKFVEHRENVLQDKTLSITDKIGRIRKMLDEPTYASLIMRNQIDLRLYEYALGLFAKVPWFRGERNA